MNIFKYTLPAIALLLGATACSEDEPIPGNPVMDVKSDLSTAHFGDSLPFVINANDVQVPLSTLKAKLFFGEELVSETVIRTKDSGKDYTGKIYIPYYANIPDATATLRLYLQNINFTITELEYDLAVTHADYPELYFEDSTGQRFKMTRTEKYNYQVKSRFPQKNKGFIIAPKYGDNGNELRFGYESNQIKVGAESGIPFSNAKAGNYAITFNTFSFEASPFVVLKFGDNEFESIDDNTSQLDLNLVQGQNLKPDGFPQFEEWWIDPDFFKKNDDGSLTFLPISGRYRIIADSQRQYFRVYALNGNNPATLNDDGSGAIWIIGANVGKPSVGGNEVGWTTENALCMAQISPKIYQATFVGGKTISTNAINFKFFHQMGWGGEFGGDALTSTSPIVKVGTGENGHDNGNLYLEEGTSLKENCIYVFTIDATAGSKSATLTVTENGEQPFEEKRVFLNDVKMNTTDNSMYDVVLSLTQNQTITSQGIASFEDIYVDPDYFNYNADEDKLTFLPLDGDYKIKFNKAQGYLSAIRMNGTEEATLGADGHGAIWLMSWGLGSPSLDSQFGWDPGKAYCMAEVAPKVYQFTGVAGPEHGSVTGMRFRTDYLSFKFFHQDGWGGEFSGNNALTLTEGAKAFIKDDGNFVLADGVNLEEGKTYRITIDLANGNAAGTIDFKAL